MNGIAEILQGNYENLFCFAVVFGHGLFQKQRIVIQDKIPRTRGSPGAVALLSHMRPGGHSGQQGLFQQSSSTAGISADRISIFCSHICLGCSEQQHTLTDDPKPRLFGVGEDGEAGGEEGD